MVAVYDDALCLFQDTEIHRIVVDYTTQIAVEALLYRRITMPMQKRIHPILFPSIIQLEMGRDISEVGSSAGQRLSGIFWSSGNIC